MVKANVTVCEILAMITVFLITDDPAVRTHFLMSVALEPDMLALGVAGSVMEALELVPRLEPGVIVVDTDAPGSDAASAARLLRAVSSRSAVVALGVPDHWMTHISALDD